MGWLGTLLETAAEKISCCKKKERPKNRTVHVGHKHTPEHEVVIEEKFCSNRIVSSKYTGWNFLPKNLFEQFQRVANFYFLCVGVIALFIDSPVSPATSLAPLVFVVSVTLIKQGYEDWLRHKADKEVNNRQTYVIKDDDLQQIYARDIQVGDIVKVNSNDSIPCDMVMLSSYDPDGNCYITTANLDGETNLKVFSCVNETKHMQQEADFRDFRATIVCEQPITDLYNFTGRLEMSFRKEDTTIKPLGPENVLLRGSRLKNTSYIFGCAIYTGQETKISLNSKVRSAKYSRIERTMNVYLTVFLLVLLVESAVLTGLKIWYYQQPEHSSDVVWYQPSENSLSFLFVLEEFLSYMVLLNYIIPISLYVTVELQKFFGSMFFEWDVDMYDVQTNEPAKAKTSDLNEELGQIEYLFTDKTGTLTENDMQFRQCSVSGNKYIEVGGMLCKKPDIPDVQPSPLPSLPPDVERLFTVLALCHTCRVDHPDTQGTGAYSMTGFEYEYQASSPDEKALVEACRRQKIVYHGKRDKWTEVSFKGDMKRFVVHEVLDFDPTRKRMSVIVEDEEGNITLLCKGAETALLDRAADGDPEGTEKHVTEYAMLGLRTLVIAERRLSESEFSNYSSQLKEARMSSENKQSRLAELFNEIEGKLTLLGVTAVEDQLQDGVPETITALRDAGIQVWVLTGDKEETAVNVSYSAGHFVQGMHELRLTKMSSVENCGEAVAEIGKILQNYKDYGAPKYCLIVDGHTLIHVLAKYKTEFRDMCDKVVTVLCCRLSPIQKAEVVKLIKTSKKDPTVAAIGDGANDVSMIQEAHVGIGLMGKEGRQAVRSSDYAFGRFKFLKKALLVHGHYFYIRLATLVQYFFYKNVAFITAQVYFNFYSAFSTQSLYETISLMFYNITFTSLPILIYGLFEQHIPQSELMRRPALYKKIRRNERLSIAHFLRWNITGLYHSVVTYFGVHILFHEGVIFSADGKAHHGVYDFGFIICTVVVIVVNIKLMLEWYYWNSIAFASFALGLIGYFLLNYFYSLIDWYWLMSEWPMFRAFENLMGLLSVWLMMLVLVVLALIPDIMTRALRDSFSTTYRRQHKQKTARVSSIGIVKVTDESDPNFSYQNYKLAKSNYLRGGAPDSMKSKKGRNKFNSLNVPVIDGQDNKAYVPDV